MTDTTTPETVKRAEIWDEIFASVVVDIAKAVPTLLGKDTIALAHTILRHQHILGVVIKVERLLPQNPYPCVPEWENPSEENLAYLQCQKDMEGYAPTAPLIEVQDV